MKLFTKNTFRNLALSALSAAVLSACGGAGSCATCTTPTPAPGDLTLKIEAPTQYPAGVAVTAYLTMTNTSNTNGTNLVYTVPSGTNYTGVTITPDANGAGQNCANIAAGASCTFTAAIPAGSTPGSFTVTATPNGSKSSATKATQAGKSLQAGDSISVTANLGLVDVPNTSNEYYVLPSDQTVQGSTGSESTVYVSVWVKQAGAGLNSLKLVDELGTDLTYVAVGTPSYALNSVNSYKVTIPAGKTIQHIQVLSNTCTTLNNGENNNTACSNDADVNLAQSGVGILAIQPNYFNMSSSHESQVVTLQNVGTANITAMQMPVIAAPFSVLANTCTGITSLKPADSCSVIIGYTAGIDSGQGSYVVNYNNGTSAVNTTATIPYVGTTPTDYAILTTTPTSFSLSASHPLQRITVTNTGTAGATGITLPTLTAPLTESVGFTTCTAGSSLPIGSSCSYAVYIDYTQAQSAGRESVTFSYNNGQQPQTTSVAADWAVLSGALLQITPQNSSDFGNVANNNSESSLRIFKVKNNGDVIATELYFYDTPDTNDLYAVMTTPPSDMPTPWCNTSYGANQSLSSNSSCYYAIKFGPVPSSIPLGVESDTAVVDYKSLGQNKSVSESLTATVIAAACNPCSIFVTPELATAGDLVTGANSSPVSATPPVSNGYAGGDAICQYYAGTNSYSGTYKALIAGTNRVPGGSDWVLQASTPYIRASDSVAIATSTESAILPDPLANTIVSNSNPILTGFVYNANPWAFNASSSCQSWTSASNSEFATYADAMSTHTYGNSMTTPMIFGYLVSNEIGTVCDNPSLRLYCVQQDNAVHPAMAAGALSYNQTYGACGFTVTGLPAFNNTTSVTAIPLGGSDTTNCTGQSITCTNHGSGNVFCEVAAQAGNYTCSTTVSSSGYSNLATSFNLIACR